MNYRNTEILDAKTLTGAGTEVIPLNVQQPISRLMLQWIITKTQNGMDSYAHKDITRIELVDGSDVLHSLDGGQNQALCIYDRKVGTMNHGSMINSNSQRSTYGIDFGRFLYDPELAFDPTKFRNPQIKVTYDSDVSDTGSTEGTLEVWADIFDEKVISPIGFLTAKEHFSGTPPASGYTYIDLPTDMVYRKLLIQGYHKEYEPWYVIASAKLSEDNDKRTPFDVNLEVYHQLRKGIDQAVEETIAFAQTADVCNLYVTPTDYWATYVGLGQTASTPSGVGAEGRGGHIYVTGGCTQQQGLIRGWLPNHCFQFPFGRQDQIDDWYDVTKVGSLRLRLEEATYTAGQIQAVILQQLRRY